MLEVLSYSIVKSPRDDRLQENDALPWMREMDTLCQEIEKVE
jgi:hypothetical protein